MRGREKGRARERGGGGRGKEKENTRREKERQSRTGGGGQTSEKRDGEKGTGISTRRGKKEGTRREELIRKRERERRGRCDEKDAAV